VKLATAPLFAAAVLLAGCGGSSDDTDAAATNSGAGNPLTAPADYVGAVGAAHRQADRVTDLTSITRAVQAFQAGEDRLPASLQELVSEGYLPRLPDPPRGSRFEYDPSTGRVRIVPSTQP